MFIATFVTGNAAPKLHLRAPTGTTPITAGSECSISWHASEYAGALDIRIWDGQTGYWATIAVGIQTEMGVFTWRVPNTLSGNLFRIEIRASESPNLVARSAAFLTIQQSATETTSILSSSALEEWHEQGIARPNPCSSRVMLELGRLIPNRIELIDISSGISYPRLFTLSQAGACISTDDLPAGAYILHARGFNGESLVMKVVVRHSE
jgi:hypothetical protein